MVNKMLLHENSIESLSRQPCLYSFAHHPNPYAADTPYSTTTQPFGIIILHNIKCMVQEYLHLNVKCYQVINKKLAARKHFSFSNPLTFTLISQGPHPHLLLNLKWFQSLTFNPCTVSWTPAPLTIPTHREIHALKKTPTANYHEHALFTINPMSRALLIPDPYKHVRIQPPYISKTLTPPPHPLRPFYYPKLCSVMTPAYPKTYSVLGKCTTT